MGLQNFIVTNELGYRDADTFEEALDLMETMPGQNRPVILMEEGGSWYEISFKKVN